jgi:hypothetical protein
MCPVKELRACVWREPCVFFASFANVSIFTLVVKSILLSLSQKSVIVRVSGGRSRGRNFFGGAVALAMRDVKLPELRARNFWTCIATWLSLDQH